MSYPLLCSLTTCNCHPRSEQAKAQTLQGEVGNSSVAYSCLSHADNRDDTCPQQPSTKSNQEFTHVVMPINPNHTNATGLGRHTSNGDSRSLLKSAQWTRKSNQSTKITLKWSRLDSHPIKSAADISEFSCEDIVSNFQECRETRDEHQNRLIVHIWQAMMMSPS